MNKPLNIKIEFSMEPADRSVGIMSEGFSAWNINGIAWCYLDEYQVNFKDCKFSWYDNETGDKIAYSSVVRDDKLIVEHALHGFVNGFYAREEEIADGMIDFEEEEQADKE